MDLVDQQQKNKESRREVVERSRTHLAKSTTGF